MACRFPLDEMVHVELCARLASELGGGVPLLKCPPQTVSYDGKCLLPVATPRPVPASVDGGVAR
ncbi:hypothetical protein [Archangium lansingense]|uniref:Uncharacterized protein n=2 Tax=Archangium lansingense TaxID=2995310 RepID=A0ABT4AD08_9BACT|nr:hypothetical protein [Archangium lansinium]MCY1078802.1 hypothetical protein [Archangium lansinium]